MSRHFKSFTVGLAATAFAISAGHAGSDRILRKETTIQAPLEQVWSAWTTEDGLRFLSAESNIGLRVLGPYEWFLDGKADEDGIRGSQGSRVLAFLPEEMLAFEWTFPPDTPTLRRTRAKTQVIVRFERLQGGGTRVRLASHGWGQGDEWDKGFEYFDAAWEYVLQEMKKHLEVESRSH